MATLATLRDNVVGALGLDASDDTRVVGWLNDGVVDMLRRTRCHAIAAVGTLTSGEDEYELDTGVLELLEVYLYNGSVNNWLTPISYSEITRMRMGTNANAAGTTSYIAMTGNVMLFYPTPGVGDTLYVYYVPVPTPLSGDTDTPATSANGGIPSHYHYGLELYAMWKGGAYKDDTFSQQGERYRLEYEGNPGASPGTAARLGYIGRMRQELRRKSGVRSRSFKIYQGIQRPYSASQDLG